MNTAIHWIGCCAVCQFAFEPVGRIDADEIAICRSCQHDGYVAAECHGCGEYDAINAKDALCDDCWEKRDEMEAHGRHSMGLLP